MGVMWVYAASPLLVCDACCGLSAGTFNSYRTNVSSRERAHGAGAASAPNWGKMSGTWSLLVGGLGGGVTPPHFPLLLWCHAAAALQPQTHLFQYAVPQD